MKSVFFFQLQTRDKRRVAGFFSKILQHPRTGGPAARRPAPQTGRRRLAHRGLRGAQRLASLRGTSGQIRFVFGVREKLNLFTFFFCNVRQGDGRRGRTRTSDRRSHSAAGAAIPTQIPREHSRRPSRLDLGSGAHHRASSKRRSVCTEIHLLKR